MITKALVDAEVLLCAETSGIADGISVKIKIVENDDDDVATLSASVKDNKVECKWKVIYTADDDDSNSQKEMEEKGYTLPEYVFTVECDDVESDESGQLDLLDYVTLKIKDFESVKGKKIKLMWKDGSSKEFVIDKKEMKLSDLFIGSAFIEII